MCLYEYMFVLLSFLIIGCSDNQIKIINEKSLKDSSFSVSKVTDTVKQVEQLKQVKYAIAKYDCPVLNTSDFKDVYGGKNGSTLKKSKTGLVKPLEFVAFPGTVFEILDSADNDGTVIYKVKTDEYPIILEGDNLYIDSRFVSTSYKKTELKPKVCPPENYIYDYFDKSGNTFYVWGGNNIEGIDKMMEFYPPSKKLSSEDELTWKIKGVDCSGLIYEATKGYTPRNTHQLVSFGESVEIEGLSASQIISRLKPLDLIVWKGHLIIVYDENTTIESSHSANGVTKKNLFSVLKSLLSKRNPSNEWNDMNQNSFVIRRWYKD
ncbi:MAG: peptidoglycan endopeptidase [Ignavibacteria bacterium]|nr:peptidoglycan endopeptidase [Ignavibacteria bacterium]